MNASQIKKLYRYAAIIIFLAAFVVTGYFIYLGTRAKQNQTINTPATVKTTESSPNYAEQTYRLLISKIGVSAPIILNVNGSDKEAYNKALENGIAHLTGSALPGRTGNVFIFGHSSYYPDKPGNYKEVFIKLNDLSPGDIMEIQSTEARFVYRITGKSVVEPTDVEVAKQNPDLHQLTVMTCWPIGTTKQRLVVVGELVEQ